MWRFAERAAQRAVECNLLEEEDAVDVKGKL
jgi:hypothetical protein